jgi:hypothetical protein
MNCPACKELMVVLELDDVEIDYCIRCQGIWLDAGELELLLENSHRRDAFLSSFQVEINAGEKKKKCPQCRKKMNKLSLPGSEQDSAQRKKKILIDGCPGQHGIWFDRGELYETLKRGGLTPNDPVITWLREVFRDGLSD